MLKWYNKLYIHTYIIIDKVVKKKLSLKHMNQCYFLKDLISYS